MNLFINDKPIFIKSFQDLQTGDFDVILDGNDVLISKYLVGKVMVQNAKVQNIERLLKIMEVKKLSKLEQVTFFVQDVKVAQQVIKDNFKIVKAGGGVVEKDDKILMIFRLKKWDLPKGKLKTNENPREGAKREVEEECNIRVEVKDKICTTWHSYTRKGKRYLKRISWFRMACINDKNMQPQFEEDIEEVRWMERKEVGKLLKKSYKSIEAVFEQYTLSLQSS